MVSAIHRRLRNNGRVRFDSPWNLPSRFIPDAACGVWAVGHHGRSSGRLSAHRAAGARADTTARRSRAGYCRLPPMAASGETAERLMLRDYLHLLLQRGRLIRQMAKVSLED